MTNEQRWGPTGVGRRGDPPRTLTGLVVSRLRRDIIANRLTPGGHLSVANLMRRYDVGSSPVREALVQVASEGLIRGAAHRGFHVADINTAEMLDISSLRADFEARALRLSIEAADTAWMARVKGANEALAGTHAQINEAASGDHSGASEDWETRHQELHFALCSNCGSPWLLHFIDVLYDHLERYRRYFWNYRTRIEVADDEHNAIVQAALRKDAEQAVALLRSHFQTQAELSLMMAAAPAEPRRTQPADQTADA